MMTLLDTMPPALMGDASRSLRLLPLDDISVRSGGDGRTVDAYAAVFNVRQSISDWEGEYEEIILPAAFDKTLAEGALGRVQVLFNHGLTIHGMSSERYSMPLGPAIDARADRRGLLTSWRASATPLGDEVLELIKDGAIRSMSFGGRWVVSKRIEPTKVGKPLIIERHEIALRDFGPATFAAYPAAAILGTRTAADLVSDIERLSAAERAQLVRILSGTPDPAAVPGTGAGEPPANTDTPGTAARTGTVTGGPSIDVLLLANAQRRRR